MQTQFTQEKYISSKIDKINKQELKYSKTKELENKIELKSNELLKNNFNNISTEFSNKVYKDFIRGFRGSLQFRYQWEIYNKINEYIHCSSENKSELLNDIKNSMLKSDKNSMMEKDFTKAIYTSKVAEVINIHKSLYPTPPVSLFDPDNTPQFLKEKEEKNSRIVTEFKKRNEQDPSLESKVLFIQRHCRAKIRQDSEIQRINGKYFNDSHLSTEEATQKSIEAINDANTPYYPQKCNKELADRIFHAADHLSLYSSVHHMTATQHIAKILDECLYGRENLINKYTDFRPAALTKSDIDDGDGNVICFGPDKIDPLCLQNRTIELNFDLPKLLKKNDFNTNPAIFFKQRDFGFDINEYQTLNLKDETIIFRHTGYLTNRTFGHVDIQLFTNRYKLEYYSEVPKYSLISYNLKELHKIWILNFFRFLDTLKEVDDDTPALAEIRRIYGLISQMSDSELIQFLSDMGRKMSCSSEFNFYGAYKIDLEALTHLSFYIEETKQDSVEIKTVLEEINKGSFDSLNKIKLHAPEIFKSQRFVDFLFAKICDPEKTFLLKSYLQSMR